MAEAIAEFRRATREGSTAEGLAALYAYESQIPEVSKTKREGLEAFYGIVDEDATRFFSVHEKADVWHRQVEREALGRVADTPEARDEGARGGPALPRRAQPGARRRDAGERARLLTAAVDPRRLLRRRRHASAPGSSGRGGLRPRVPRGRGALLAGGAPRGAARGLGRRPGGAAPGTATAACRGEDGFWRAFLSGRVRASIDGGPSRRMPSARLADALPRARVVGGLRRRPADARGRSPAAASSSPSSPTGTRTCRGCSRRTELSPLLPSRVGLGDRGDREAAIRRSSGAPARGSAVPAAEALHVGDSPREDVEGARGAGLDGAASRSRTDLHPDAPDGSGACRELLETDLKRTARRAGLLVSSAPTSHEQPLFRNEVPRPDPGRRRGAASIS